MMNIPKQKLIMIIVSIVAAVSVGGAVIYNVTKPEEKVEKTVEKTVNEHEGEMRSFLTGEWVDEEVGTKRPVAIMTENIPAAMPQYGLSKAGVIYECPMEGGLTRLMPIYEDYSGLDKIGNVRSCRPYFAYFAAEFDAIYVHYGQSRYAEPLLNNGLVNNISGLDGAVNKSFFRSNDRKAPHNAYTSEEGIKSGIEKKGYNDTYAEDFTGHYKFADEDSLNTLSDGSACEVVKLYYPSNKPSFVYDKESKTYKRYQYNDAQKDAVNDAQLEVTNIILQNVTGGTYDCPEGYLDLNVSGSGSGKFITQGKIIDITWTKGEDGITHYYDLNNNEIQLNPGKTWVSVIQEQSADKNVFYDTVENYEASK